MALTDQSTAKLTPDNKSTVTNQYFDLDQPFAVPRYGNACKSYICGRDYMKDVAAAIRAAEHFIFIADWQLDYDVELDQRGVPGHPGRLSELLADALARGVHVRVLCYDSQDSLSYALTVAGSSGPPDTHEEESQSTLDDLPKGKGSIKMVVQNANTGRSTADNMLFSHHQKFVVVDGHTAFLGGIDLAYGRWETPAFQVTVDPRIHVLNDAYNQQVAPAREPSAAELALTKKQSNGRPGFAPPHYSGGKKLLDPATQPREPWNDVAVRIKGPAVYDVFVNFVLRWNSFAGSGTNTFDGALSLDWFEGQAKGHLSLVDPLQKGAGSATVQICRSASSAQLKDELVLWSESRKYIQDDWKQPDPARRKAMEAARKAWAGNNQTSILDAMVQCIRAAQAFIYIENQFFVTDCGRDAHGTQSPAHNPIVAELANAIGQAIHAGRPFHVWLVFPEHPEGMLEVESTSSSAWWALQSIKHGNNSLINRINATLFGKYKKSWGIASQPRTNADIHQALKDHGMENKWREYLTVLNPRNYGATPKAIVTEMVYVHSKLTIVDDAVAIIGSANINDRSLMGNGDTEIAAVIVDDAEAQMTDMGQGVRCVTRKFARDLRMTLWKKHFGMLIDEPTSGVQKESQPPLGVKLEQPLDKASINGIQAQAIVNRQAYNRVFTHTPRNEFKTLLEGRSHYPAITKRVKKYKVDGVAIGEFNPDGTRRNPYVWVDEPTKAHDFTALPPLQSAFMNGPLHNIDAAIKELRGSVKGFLAEMPLDWGAGETATPKPPASGPLTIARSEPVPVRESVSDDVESA